MDIDTEILAAVEALDCLPMVNRVLDKYPVMPDWASQTEKIAILSDLNRLLAGDFSQFEQGLDKSQE